MARGTFDYGNARYVNPYASMQDSLADIQSRRLEERKLAAEQGQRDLDNTRADKRLKMLEEAEQRTLDDRLATKNALTTQVRLGDNVEFDFAQTHGQTSISDAMSNLYAPTDKVFNEGYQSVLNKVGIDEKTLQQGITAGDKKAIELNNLAYKEGNTRADSLASKLKLPEYLGDNLAGMSHVQALSTPTLEQEYNARKNAAIASGSPAAIKAVDDAMLDAVTADKNAKAKAATDWAKREDTNLNLRADVLKKTISSGGSVSAGTSTDNLDKLMTSMNIDQSNWLNDDKGAIFSLANKLKDSKDYKGIDVNKYIADELRTGDYTTGEVFSGSQKVEKLNKLKSSIANRIKAHKAEGIAYKVGKKNNSTSLDRNMAEMDKLIEARAALTRDGSHRLSESINQIDKYIGGFKPTKAQVEEAILSESNKDTTKNSTMAGAVGNKAIKDSISVRNNNPGNLRGLDVAYEGKTGNNGGFSAFKTPEHGVRALYNDLNIKINRGQNTVESIIKQYAPDNENDTKSYIEFVSNKLNIKPDDAITEDKMFDLVKSITHYEGSRGSLDTFTDDVIQKGIGMSDEGFEDSASDSSYRMGSKNEVDPNSADGLKILQDSVYYDSNGDEKKINTSGKISDKPSTIRDSFGGKVYTHSTKGLPFVSDDTGSSIESIYDADETRNKLDSVMNFTGLSGKVQEININGNLVDISHGNVSDSTRLKIYNKLEGAGIVDRKDSLPKRLESIEKVLSDKDNYSEKERAAISSVYTEMRRDPQFMEMQKEAQIAGAAIGVTTSAVLAMGVAGLLALARKVATSKEATAAARESAKYVKSFYEKIGGKSTTPKNSRILQESVAPRAPGDGAAFYKRLFGG